MPGPLDVKWIHGSPDCATSADPPVQVHAFDPDTFILRQSKCLNFEAPFLYLLFGRRRALLLDTGAAPIAGKTLPLRDTIDEIFERRRAARTGADDPELLVAHSHSHGDHLFGDGQLRARPRTKIAPTGVAGVSQFFGLSNWPVDTAVLDLGDRPLTILAIPGHEPSHIALYDPVTRVVLSGDALYPGFLYVRDWGEYRRSADRLAEFVVANPVDYVLGAHIEMSAVPRVAYPSPNTYQPNEHALELLSGHVVQLQEALQRAGDRAVEIVLDDFIVQPLA